MIQILDLTDSPLEPVALTQALPRAEVDVTVAMEQVLPLISDVRHRGELALREQAERFDGVIPGRLAVPPTEITDALQGLDPLVRSALEVAIQRARRAHEVQVPAEVETLVGNGAVIRQRWIPVNRVGLYVPGGLAVYPSSVVMNVVAAQTAGVASIAVASPAQREFGGSVHPTILAACALLGVDEVYAVGGAGAIGMFAYGVPELCDSVDVVTGPGNIYVAAAKRAVMGQVGIDAEAGTTEIAIIADASANAAFVAADLISQAEHDPAAASVLISSDDALIADVQRELQQQVAQSHHRERITIALAGPQSGIVRVADLDAAVAVANAYAAEHLEIQTKDAPAVAKRIKNAGAIFVGDYSPVSLGDYVAGSNHVLPTGGTARFAAGLSAMTFIKPVQQIEYTREALDAVTDPLVALAQDEDLPAHGEAALIRRS